MITKRNLIFTLFAFALLFGFDCRAGQTVSVKSNLLYDALLSPNLGLEFGVAPKWSVDISGNYNGWKLSHGRQWKHWLVQPELRRWLRAEDCSGHFLAAHIFGGQFNTTLNRYRRQGWAAGLGVGYGFAWRLGPHWGLEAEIAVGYARYGYDKYPCSECGRKIATRHKNYVGPTKAAINLVYYFGASKSGKPLPVIPDGPVVPPVVTVVADTLPVFDFPLVDVPHSKVLTENLAGVARIRFEVNKTDIDPALADNRAELAAITGRLDSIRDNLGMDIHRIELIGYASPEGSYTNNDRLASSRTAALKSFLRAEADLADSIMTVSHIAEDWAGLRAAILASDLPDRDALLDIIDSDRPADSKEALLRRHKASWARIAAEMLPPLRRTEYRIEYRHRYEEVEIQTLEEVNRYISDGNVTEAARLLVNIPPSPEADYARGVVAALQHRYAEAQAWFSRALARGVKEASRALTLLNSKTNHNIY